jgi:RNA polymerase sigma factor (sigma-70 family)
MDADDALLARTPGDPEAFGAFYERHERLVLGWLVRRTGDPELAADLCAETFAAALLAASRYRPGGAPAAAWLLGIARHVLAGSLRRRRVEDRARRRLDLPVLVLDDELLERIAAIGADERADALLARLPADQAGAVRARVLDEQPYDRIAAGLRCSESVVRQRVSRGLAQLRRIYEEEA